MANVVCVVDFFTHALKHIQRITYKSDNPLQIKLISIQGRFYRYEIVLNDPRTVGAFKQQTHTMYDGEKTILRSNKQSVGSCETWLLTNVDRNLSYTAENVELRKAISM